MTTTDQIRSVIRDLEAKAKQLELDRKLTLFADQADRYLRVAATRAGEYAAENRERVETTIDRAGAKVDEKTDGKYHRTVDKLKTGILTGVDWVVEQRETAPAPATAAAGPATDDAPATPAGAAASGPAHPDAWVDVTDDAPATPAGAAASGPAHPDAWVDVTDDAPATHDPRTEGPTDPR